eukprot:TRINITY_DN3280_c0_g2_i1.p1 TRINITY_DN3280_c0_g2~~TRINITY_DN3280_c0_g2_i1.p1  ORF type:complete len:588 (+),score=229.24 TRINITY_DN3280_c0_g2_i1:229-1992(+)
MKLQLVMLLLAASAGAIDLPSEEMLRHAWKLLSEPGALQDHLRFDLYTRGVVNLTLAAYKAWPDMNATFVPPPSVSGPLPSSKCGMFEDIVVPIIDETWPSASEERAAEVVALAEQAPFPQAAWLSGKWEEGVSKQAAVEEGIGAARNPDRILVPWGPERDTDEGLSAFVFQGVGQHRVQKVRPDDKHAESAVYAVYLSDAEDLEVRSGFARLGADAYFTADQKVTHIRRLGRTYYPSMQGWEKHTAKGMSWRECCEVDGWYNCLNFEKGCDCHVPTKIGFRHARMAFLGTLLSIVTVHDHLLWTHLSVANAVVTAGVQELATHHPLRVLMHPHTFRTADINWIAVYRLVNENGHLHRLTPLTADSIRALAKSAQKAETGMRFETPPQRHAAQGLATDAPRLPLHEDGGDFFAVVKAHVHRYMSAHYDYATNGCGGDEGVRRWVARANTLMPLRDLPTGDALTCESLEDVLATFIYTVTANHAHVGQVTSEVVDPCHAPQAWREGELCATPRSAFSTRSLIESTALPMPKLRDDYSHLFPTAVGKQMWQAFQTDLAAFQERVAARNAVRPRAFRSFDMDIVEVSVAI